MSIVAIQVKAVLLGDSGVGKSSIVLRFVADNFNTDGEATVGASYMGKILEINEKSIKFNIWDTAGQERYHSLAKMYYRDATAAILVYDITNRESFQGLKRWHSELLEFGPKGIAIVIVGNKEDLIQSEVIPTEEAQEFARSINALYKRTSAKTNAGIDLMFRDLALKLFPSIEKNEEGKKSTIVMKRESFDEAKKKKGCC